LWWFVKAIFFLESRFGKGQSGLEFVHCEKEKTKRETEEKRSELSGEQEERKEADEECVWKWG
jgi:hypothetical protein